MKTSILCLVLGMAGCGFIDQGEPRILAHRAGGRYWPENSQRAILGSIDEGFGGIEVDVRLTADRVPVLVHDPHINPDLCTRVDEAAFAPETIAVHELTFSELASDYRCGGGPPVSLAQLVELVRRAPEMQVMLDVKSDAAPFTAPEIAEAILGVWTAAAPPNPWFAASLNREVVRAFTDWEREHALAVEAHYMVFLEEDGEGTEYDLGLHDHLEVAWSCGADGMVINHRFLSWSSAQDLRSRGLRIGVMGVRDRDLVDALSGWPIDYILTDAAREVQDPET